jgi:hypothetical protein
MSHTLTRKDVTVTTYVFDITDCDVSDLYSIAATLQKRCNGTDAVQFVRLAEGPMRITAMTREIDDDVMEFPPNPGTGRADMESSSVSTFAADPVSAYPPELLTKTLAAQMRAQIDRMQANAVYGKTHNGIAQCSVCGSQPGQPHLVACDRNVDYQVA